LLANRLEQRRAGPPPCRAGEEAATTDGERSATDARRRLAYIVFRTVGFATNRQPGTSSTLAPPFQGPRRCARRAHRPTHRTAGGSVCSLPCAGWGTRQWETTWSLQLETICRRGGGGQLLFPPRAYRLTAPWWDWA